jgi:hypothetical protein
MTSINWDADFQDVQNMSVNCPLPTSFALHCGIFTPQPPPHPA